MWTDRELSESATVKAPVRMVAMAKALVSEDESGSATGSCGSSATSDSQLSNASVTKSGSKQNSKQNHGTDLATVTMSDIIVAEILSIFKSLILPTHRCRCVQFYVFYVVR